LLAVINPYHAVQSYFAISRVKNSQNLIIITTPKNIYPKSRKA